MADATSRADASKQATPMTAPTKNEMSDDRCRITDVKRITSRPP